MKYEDKDCDGVRDPNEPGLPGWTIWVADYWGTYSTTTNALGQYSFFNLAQGLHFAWEIQQPGWIQTFPVLLQHTVYQPVYNSILTGVDFGNLDLSKCQSIAYDTCRAGTPDNFQPGTPEFPTPSPALMSFLNEFCHGNPILDFDDIAMDQCFGHTFRNCYDTACCVVSAQLCMRLRATNIGSWDDGIFLGDWPGAPNIYQVSLNNLLSIHTAGLDTLWTPGDTMTVCLDLANLPPYGSFTSVMPLLQDGQIDFMMFDDTQIDFLRLIVGRCCPGQDSTCSISGTKFFDKDRDGVHDVGENGLSGWTIELYYQGGPLYASTTTDGSGNYTFSNLPCTTFTVVEVNQPNWVQTFPSPNQHNINLGTTGSVTGVNFANFRCSDSPNDTCCTKVPPQMIAWYSFDETTPTTTYDLAGGDNPGTQIGSFLYGPGKVGGAYRFGPALSYLDIVRVHNDPFVTVGSGDFSADAWIYPVSFSTNCSVFMTNVGNGPCVDPIFDNRQWFFGGSGLDGVSFFVADDGQGTGTANLGLVMSSFPTPQTTFLSPPGAVQLNQWQHVAVTVSRSTGVGRFYLNGNLLGTFTPISGPLYSTNAGPILDIGHGTFLNTGSCYLTNRYFDGWIDELEIFNRALGQSEIQSLYSAGSKGKCKVSCSVPKVVSFCKGQLTKPMTLTICNTGYITTMFNYSIAGLASGPGCNVSGTGFTFAPSSGTTGVLLPGQCTNITINVTRPAGFVPGNIACFTVSILDPVTGASTTCSGQFTATNKWCIKKWEPAVPISLRVGQQTVTSIEIGNDEDSVGMLPYRIDAFEHESDQNSRMISLNGLPPGTPVIGQLMVPLGGSTILPVDLNLVQFEALETIDLVLSADTDGDGTFEPALSAVVQPTSIVDCNANGVADDDDIAQGTSLDANANGVPDECEAVCTQAYCSRCYVCGDADANLLVTISDAVYLINYIFAGGPEPNPKLAGDTDCNSLVTISDVVYLINYIFAGGPKPCNGCP